MENKRPYDETGFKASRKVKKSSEECLTDFINNEQYCPSFVLKEIMLLVLRNGPKPSIRGVCKKWKGIYDSIGLERLKFSLENEWVGGLRLFGDVIFEYIDKDRSCQWVEFGYSLQEEQGGIRLTTYGDPSLRSGHLFFDMEGDPEEELCDPHVEAIIGSNIINSLEVESKEEARRIFREFDFYNTKHVFVIYAQGQSQDEHVTLKRCNDENEDAVLHIPYAHGSIMTWGPYYTTFGMFKTITQDGKLLESLFQRFESRNAREHYW